MKKKDKQTVMVIIALVAIILLYKTGFLASFVTTCTNIEPDTTEGFKTLMEEKLLTTTEMSGPSITYKEETLGGNQTITTEYEFTSMSYSNEENTYAVYDTTPIKCKYVINYLLEMEEERIAEEFTPELVRPGYDETATYYSYDETNHVILTEAPGEGEEYYKQEGTDYVLMPIPYMTAPPTLSNNPYMIYTPVGYKSISGKIINGILYWCSDNTITLLRADNNHYEAINKYGEAVIICETVYINDTQKILDQCIDDGGEWADEGYCECSQGEDYTPGSPCARATTTGTSTTTSSGVVSTTAQPEETTGLGTSNKLIMVVAALTIIGGGYYLFKKKGRKKVKKRKR